jgi:hypothetical protein
MLNRRNGLLNSRVAMTSRGYQIAASKECAKLPYLKEHIAF